MKNKPSFVKAVGAIMVLLLLTFSSFSVISAEDPEPEEVEVRNYKGAKLGSVEDFRENSIKGVQEIDKDEYRLQITGLINEDRALTYEELQEMDHVKKIVTLQCVEGWRVKALWGGIPLKDVFSKLDINPEVNTVIFHAADGYTSSLSVEHIMDNNIIIADHLNGIQLPPEQGFPFQLVAEQKWGYKWVRWITKIELSANDDYKGYWESRGYSDDGDLDEPKFGN
ncbi:molybdopterin-dependent oxidoreductase [Candidatus Bipolaricaulota bacterium]|nr:molybdopterin-dependent oxidoreductase [Candidatus Bipolaricaulota bacterium]